MAKYSGLILIPTSRKERRKLFGKMRPGMVVADKFDDPVIVQFNGELRPARPGELDEPYHQARK